MIITQEIVNETFRVRNNTCGLYCCYDDIDLIQKTLFDKFQIVISFAEVIDFWRWRSEQYDASWLAVMSEEEILEWFNKFIIYVGVNDV